MLSQRDLGWVAGFLEGEGSFTLTAAKHPRVIAVQVAHEPLDRLFMFFGGSICEKKPNGFGKKPLRSWAVNGAKAVGIMMTLYPIMSPERKAQIKRTLAAWKSTPPNFGENHRIVTVKDDMAREAIQHVLDGESMTSVAHNLGLTHATVSMWVRGIKRPYLRQQVSGERSAWIKVRRPGMITDDAALEGIRRVRNGETKYRVAKDIGVTPEALGYWVRGEHRPYLLAQLGES